MSITFKAFLESEGITETAAAEQLGYSQAAVSRWCNGRVPRFKTIIEIKGWSAGKVTESDWISTEEKKPARSRRK